jgi:hypothetical protein
MLASLGRLDVVLRTFGQRRLRGAQVLMTGL